MERERNSPPPPFFMFFFFNWSFPQPAAPVIVVTGSETSSNPVRRIWCVGRNLRRASIPEMAQDPSAASRHFYFAKPPAPMPIAWPSEPRKTVSNNNPPP